MTAHPMHHHDRHEGSAVNDLKQARVEPTKSSYDPSADQYRYFAADLARKLGLPPEDWTVERLLGAVDNLQRANVVLCHQGFEGSRRAERHAATIDELNAKLELAEQTNRALSDELEKLNHPVMTIVGGPTPIKLMTGETLQLQHGPVRAVNAADLNREQLFILQHWCADLADLVGIDRRRWTCDAIRECVDEMRARVAELAVIVAPVAELGRRIDAGPRNEMVAVKLMRCTLLNAAEAMPAPPPEPGEDPSFDAEEAKKLIQSFIPKDFAGGIRPSVFQLAKDAALRHMATSAAIPEGAKDQIARAIAEAIEAARV